LASSNRETVEVDAMSKLTSIRIFCCAANTLNFSRTAKQLNCSAAMVSKHISGLEDQLGVRLFTRSTRKIRLTEEGRSYYQQCRRLLEGLDDIEARIRCDKQAPAGILRVSFPMDFGVDIVAPLLGGFLRENPAMQIDSVYEDRQVDLIGEGFDLAIRIGRQLRDSSLIATRLGTLSSVLCTAPGYLASHPPIHNTLDLESHNCLRWTHASEDSDWHFHGDREARQVHIEGNLSANNARAVLAAALSGLGVALLPLFLAGRHLERGRLIQVLPGRTLESVGVYAVYPHHDHLPARVQALVDYLRQALQALPGNRPEASGTLAATWGSSLVGADITGPRRPPMDG
jgi:DNA-binding transcriptional LysR family regulator